MSTPSADTLQYPITQAVRSSKKPCCSAEGCRVKLALTDFPCKCQKTYCYKHRPCEEHACSFDFQGYAREILLKTMSTPVVAAKIQLI